MQDRGCKWASELQQREDEKISISFAWELKVKVRIVSIVNVDRECLKLVDNLV